MVTGSPRRPNGGRSGSIETVIEIGTALTIIGPTRSMT